MNNKFKKSQSIAKNGRLESAKRKSPSAKAFVDEEIESDSDESDDGRRETSNEDLSDEDETADAKRKRLALNYLQRFQTNYESSEAISQALQTEREKLQGKYFRNFDYDNLTENNITATRLHGHKLSVTSVAQSADGNIVCSGSKDNSVIYYDITTQSKTILKKPWCRKDSPDTQASAGEILSVAISSDGKYIASGGRDNMIRIYDIRVPNTTNNTYEIKTFQGHRDAVTSLSFRKDTYTLFSGSLDRTLKHWDLNEMGYIETMFGHQEGVLAIDSWMKNKPISVSSDRTIRLWSIEEESHLVFRQSKVTSIDCVNYIKDDEFVTGSQSGTLALWKYTLKKPICTYPLAHGYDNTVPRWICSVSSMKMSDLLLSGSYDGSLKFWKLTHDASVTNTLTPMYEYPIHGFLNSIIQHQENMIVVGVGKEHKYGRWWNIKEASNQVLLLKINNNNNNNDSSDIS